MSRTSQFFIPQKEIDTIDSMNEELIDEIVGQTVDIYKVSIDNTDENVYGESTTKYYEVGFRVNCLILFNEPEIIQDDFGADVTSLMRANRFSRVGFFNNGNKINSRYLWLNAAGTAVAKPTTLTANNMWDPVAGSTGAHTDSAANPTRAIPGELVMKVDFVTLTVASGGDFFDYKAITGM